MRTKECPSCGLTVPASASRCKDCFHDFADVQVRRTGGPLLMLGSLAAMATVGALTLWWIAGTPLDESILVDGESESVVWTRKYRHGLETDRLRFAEISKLQYVIRSNGSYEIVAVTSTGGTKVVAEAVRPLKSDAEKYAKLMEKPLEEVDQTGGFGKKR